MSRTPRNGASCRRGEEDEICPVCKSSRYLNPNMSFLVNPECYHKMCESCVDRIFSQGPAPCPVAGCARTLRKQRFRKQTFDDIHIEREVDIRARVAKIFNRREAEFTTLLDYNNYLEEVETLTFNLIHNIDILATEASLASHAAQNATAISRNAVLAGDESASLSADLSAQKEGARARREAARQEEEEEKRERAEGRREVLEKIATTSGDADAAAREARKVVLKRSTARRTAAEKLRVAAGSNEDPFSCTATADPTGYSIKGLKPILEASREKPYDPFGGVSIQKEYHTLQTNYEHPWLDHARTDPQVLAGGYDLGEYYARTMLEAFAGLGCFIEEEVAGRDGLSDRKAVGTVGAAEVTS